MKKIALYISTLMLVALTACSTGTKQSVGEAIDGDSTDMQELNDEALEEEMAVIDNPGATEDESATSQEYKKPSERPTVLDFTAEWCGWCHKLAPELHKVEKKYDGRVTFQTIDTDDEPELANEYDVQGLPTLVFLDAKGNEVTRIEGYVTAPEIEKALQQVL